jgi:hypothetical protein
MVSVHIEAAGGEWSTIRVFGFDTLERDEACYDEELTVSVNSQTRRCW